uniref:Transmembrane protein n=1 Tax=Nicotiana tabacum TaxID=4097 RepID=A0A1S4CCF9_TOBAC|nr:PREDICTED: uncharacterized protein LOC107817501 [Nicotiana tabacum]
MVAIAVSSSSTTSPSTPCLHHRFHCRISPQLHVLTVQPWMLLALLLLFHLLCFVDFELGGRRSELQPWMLLAPLLPVSIITAAFGSQLLLLHAVSSSSVALLLRRLFLLLLDGLLHAVSSSSVALLPGRLFLLLLDGLLLVAAVAIVSLLLRLLRFVKGRGFFVESKPGRICLQSSFVVSFPVHNCNFGIL